LQRARARWWRLGGRGASRLLLAVGWNQKREALGVKVGVDRTIPRRIRTRGFSQIFEAGAGSEVSSGACRLRPTIPPRSAKVAMPRWLG
jgi:hypothetical protein